MSVTFSDRIRQLRQSMGWKQEDLATRLGLSRNYVGMLENGREPSETVVKLFDLVEEQAAKERGAAPLTTREDASPYKFVPRNVHEEPITLRWVPVISWTHAGMATEYEELPAHWQSEAAPTTSRDEKAFGLIVEGDSMEPRCMSGDRVVVIPSEEPRDGCLVVAKLKKDGVVLRRFSRIAKGLIRLTPYNKMYSPVDYSPSDFHWIYPVESTIRKEWS